MYFHIIIITDIMDLIKRYYLGIYVVQYRNNGLFSTFTAEEYLWQFNSAYNGGNEKQICETIFYYRF